MGMFSFKKKDTTPAKVEEKVVVKAPANNADNSISPVAEFRSLDNDVVPPVYIRDRHELLSIDVRYSPKTKSFIYNTGLTIDVKPGHIAVIFPNKDILEKGFSLGNKTIEDYGIIMIVDGSENKEIVLEYKSNTHLFVKQPISAGEVIADCIVIHRDKLDSLLSNLNKD